MIFKNKCFATITHLYVLHIEVYEFLNVFRVTRSIATACIVFVSSPRHSGTKDDNVTAYL